jgi:hypothetical protein
MGHVRLGLGEWYVLPIQSELADGPPQVKSHAGWSAQPILSLSSQLSYSLVHVALALSIPILLLLLVSPASWVPHLSAPFVLLIPVQNTLHSVAVETKKGRSDAKDAQQ